MKTYDKMAQSALERIKEYKTEQSKRRKKAARIAVPAVCICLASVICAGALKSGLLGTETRTSYAGYTNPDGSTRLPQTDASGDPVKVTEQNGNVPQIVDNTAASSNGNVSGASSEIGDLRDENSTSAGKKTDGKAEKPDDEVVYGEWKKGSDPTAASFYVRWKNKLNVTGTLYYAMENSPGKTYAVTAVYAPPTANIKSFTYEGKTLSEIAIAAEEERRIPEKMKELLKWGDDLKYGKALYETGDSSGVKWDKRLYEDKVAYFGEDMLNKYIVDGKFLREDLERDIAALEMKITTPDGTSTVYNYDGSATAKYIKAYNAYMDTVIPSAVNKLTGNNIKCERTPYLNNGITFVVTENQLENIPLDDLQNWTFDLAGENLKGTSGTNTGDSVLKAVN